MNKISLGYAIWVVITGIIIILCVPGAIGSALGILFIIILLGVIRYINKNGG